MKTNTLTEKQKSILKFIVQTIRQQNLPPSVREIAEAFQLSSTATVRDHLKALVKKGFIKISENKARGIELIRSALFQIPVLGQVQAGMPIYAVEDLEGFLDLEDFIFPDKDIFALKVKGKSMIEAGILPEDFVLVRKQSAAQLGEIVIALCNQEEVTVKKLAKRDNQYFLDPANPEFKPIPVTPETSIIGKVLRVIRKY